MDMPFNYGTNGDKLLLSNLPYDLILSFRTETPIIDMDAPYVV